MATEAEIIAAIRADDLIGRGSCSPIDECYDDAEIVASFGQAGTIAAALKAARFAHEVWADRFEDISGEGW